MMGSLVKFAEVKLLANEKGACMLRIKAFATRPSFQI